MLFIELPGGAKMDWGMKNRFHRIIRPEDGRTVMLAVDHGYFLGPTTGLERFAETVVPLLPYADTLMLTRGALRNYIPPESDVPIVLRVSGGTSILNKNLLHEGIITSIEEAIRLNVVGVAFSILVGAEFERDTILNFTKVVDEAERYGIPVVAVTAVGRDMVKDVKYLSLATRMAGELGARIVKTYFCEGFEKVVETSPVPVVIAGGKKIPEKEALTMTYSAIEAGAAGVDMGRNIFQSENPVAMIRAVRAVVHEGYTGEEAYQLFEELKAGGGEE
ncbi:MAG: 3-hydroxy-5-phosphonooxypentane-2,4-dione thiolase [Thermoplasmata archaeon]|nr:MAG: 3-hydroxy-5-phosphonooxypentane-2,4-dione thiolase [Thermoplasmata archaeon]RLF72480.1 MAG: 3-hydroxy-5-phosphonooxypentane-2,4-dione thiolase [Thermoplasmata archaeon]RLF73440.1 MAG: 3-hydroxy-5-phosphonooxypentane-2,4-dione thiolase [Thermoplasmata archaeon]RLF76740.1 MAG: 3-hydroxy-5-phosphonooxypentane-2,4-dione thiolase [Thermoplasmata archaeon]HDD60314.1 3-hydroxy-5-phosphonooxypentane-2,4-dione thiolase [Euryarchaeota archaeon]